MPKQSNDYLFFLIKSLKPSEKRHFRLHVDSADDKADTLYIQLFNVLDKQKSFDEQEILSKISRLKSSQLSNLKANLYKQILTSLRQKNKNNSAEIMLRELLDFTQVLYSKGLYKASLNMLEKAKKIALNKKLNTHKYLILEFERKIESQHITGSMSPKATQIISETNAVLDNITLENSLSNLSLFLYGRYLKHGYIKNEDELDKISVEFKDRLPAMDKRTITFNQKQSLYKSYIWLYNMSQDFANSYRYAIKWVDLYEEFPGMIVHQIPNYLKARHNVLASLFMSRRADKFIPAYTEYCNLEFTYSSFTQNEKSLYYLYKYIHGINSFFITGDYHLSIEFTKNLESVLKTKKYNWDNHRIIDFQYKLGCVYFGQANLDRSAFFLNKICNIVTPNFKEDIQCYARILNLIVHFDLGNETLVSYQIKSVYRFLLKMDQLQKVLQEIFKFLRKTTQILEEDLKDEFISLRARLSILEKEAFERRPFLYLDIISWLDSKIYNISMQEAIKRKLSIRMLGHR